MAAVIFNLFVINKSGGLIFYKYSVGDRVGMWVGDAGRCIETQKVVPSFLFDLRAVWTVARDAGIGEKDMDMDSKDYGTQGRLDTNDSLRLASLWHSMHAISKELSPVNGCNGIELLEADTFDLHCFQALTGTKIFVATEPGTPGMDSLLKTIYELYTDYVLKNPFYEVEMPIRCELWDLNLALAVRKDGKAGLIGR